MTAVFAATAGLVFALPASLQLTSWSGLGIAYLLIVIRGSCVLSSKLLGPCTTHGPAIDQFALTFDDGPDATCTGPLLDLLAARGAKATFFCIGKRALAHAELVRRIHREGHLVANHSHSHAVSLTFAASRRMTDDLARCQVAIEGVTGCRPGFFRPPYRVRNHSTHLAASRNGLRIIGWNVGGGDTVSRSTNSLVARLRRQLAPGAIVLLHDRGAAPGKTLEITRQLLDEAAARGLRPVRLDELLGVGNGTSATGHCHSRRIAP